MCRQKLGPILSMFPRLLQGFNSNHLHPLQSRASKTFRSVELSLLACYGQFRIRPPSPVPKETCSQRVVTVFLPLTGSRGPCHVPSLPKINRFIFSD